MRNENGLGNQNHAKTSVNIVRYMLRWLDEKPSVRVFVSGTVFNREISSVKRGADARTIIFPNTVRDMCGYAFTANKRLRSAVLNEGLEELPRCSDADFFSDDPDGVFANSEIRQIKLPATLRVLRHHTFYDCKMLRRVTFAEGSALERIEGYCFASSWIEEFRAPQSLRVIDDGAFAYCGNLGLVALNEGLTRIGERRVYFEERNRKINDGAFQCYRMQEITLPGTLVEIGENTFRDSSLKTIHIADDL